MDDNIRIIFKKIEELEQRLQKAEINIDILKTENVSLSKEIAILKEGGNL